MYFVDRSKIEDTLVNMDHLLGTLNKHSYTTEIEKLGRERIIHVVIESVLDVGNMMIDGFIMRDPGSYEDIIDILVDEKVIPKEEEAAYKTFIGLRKNLVTEYTQVDEENLRNTVKESLPVLQSFSAKIRTYLKNELGVANAFLKE